MKLKKTEILVLKKVNENMTSSQGFKYPKRGYVEAKDWEDTSECGGGLHGLAWGCGIFDIESYGKIFLVIKVNKEDGYVNLGDKVKFRKGYVLKATDDSKVAIEYIKKYAPKGLVFNYDINTSNTAISGYNSNQKAGDNSTQTARDRSIQEAGNDSKQTAGYYSVQTAGFRSNQIAQDYSTQKAEDESNQIAQDYSTQKAGYKSYQKAEYEANQIAGFCSNQIAGFCSNQIAGNESTQKSGDKSTQTAGDRSTQEAGNNSIQTAGIGTIQIIKYSNDKQLVYTRVITEKEAGKPYIFKDGEWNLINKGN